MDAEKTENRSLMFGLLAVVGVTLLLAIIGFIFMRQPDEIIEGQADATSVRISGASSNLVASREQSMWKNTSFAPPLLIRIISVVQVCW